MNSTVPFGSICQLQNGRAFQSSEWAEAGVPIVRIQNLNNEDKTFNYCTLDIESRFHVNNGDLLFSWSGTPGTSFGAFFWNRGLGYLNQHIFRVDIDHSRVEKNYLRYAINAQLNIIIEQAHGGVGLKHITKGRLEAVEVPLPMLNQQKRIAAILDKADSIRRKRREALTLADDFLRAVFLEMFGDPITNPHNFPVGTIRDLVSDVRYGTSAKADETQGEFPMLRMNNLTYAGAMNYGSLKYVDIAEKDRHKYMALDGDMLFNRTNSKELVGKTAVFRAKQSMAIAGYLIRVRTNEKANTTYLSAYLNSTHGKLTLTSMCKSIVGMANINAQELQNINILIPPKSLQDRYEKIVLAVEAKRSLYHAAENDAVALLDGLSQSLLAS